MTAPGSMHYSKTKGAQVIVAMLRLGGSAATQEIHNQTGGMATHSDVSSARRLCVWLGLADEPMQAITRRWVRTTHTGSQVHRYALSETVQAALRDDRTRELLRALASARPGHTIRRTADALERHVRAMQEPVRPKLAALEQGRLFDADKPANMRTEQLR